MAASRDETRIAERRLEAIEHGRLLGEDTARSLREDERQTVQRTARAMAYAAWEFDGKTESWDRYAVEFGLAAPAGVIDSFDRPLVKIVP